MRVSAVLLAAVALTLLAACGEQRACTNGVAVPNPQRDPGLVQDCVTLPVKDRLAGDADLDWDTDRYIGEWYGVVVGGWPWRVIDLNLIESQLTGVIPPELAALTELYALKLGSNELVGPVPPELGKLTNLVELHLENNKLAGSLPAELSALVNLRELGLGGNRLTGSVPAWLGKLAQLEGLYLWENQLTGPIPIPPELGHLASCVSCTSARTN